MTRFFQNMKACDTDVHLRRYKTMPGIFWAERDIDRKWVREFNTRKEVNDARSSAERHRFYGSGKILVSEYDKLLTYLSTYQRGIYLTDEVEE